MYWQECWRSIQEYWFRLFNFIAKLFKAINHAWKSIFFTLVGNFFPIYFGGGLLYFLKKDFAISEILKPDTYIVYSAGFIVTSIFLWYKNQTRKSYVSLLLFFLFFMSISGLFILSYLENIENLDFYIAICKYACYLSIGIYIFQEIKNSYYEVNIDFQEDRDADYRNLQNNFDQHN
jgi:hypothetical protein